MKKCPYCSEEILDDAQKCKHCGEWLDGRKKEKSFDDGSAAARAITKGIKQKELHDIQYNVRLFFVILLSVILGIAFHSFWIGLGIFVILAFLAARKYYKE